MPVASILSSTKRKFALNCLKKTLPSISAWRADRNFSATSVWLAPGGTSPRCNTASSMSLRLMMLSLFRSNRWNTTQRLPIPSCPSGPAVPRPVRANRFLWLRATARMMGQATGRSIHMLGLRMTALLAPRAAEDTRRFIRPIGPGPAGEEGAVAESATGADSSSLLLPEVFPPRFASQSGTGMALAAEAACWDSSSSLSGGALAASLAALAASLSAALAAFFSALAALAASLSAARAASFSALAASAAAFSAALAASFSALAASAASFLAALAASLSALAAAFFASLVASLAAVGSSSAVVWITSSSDGVELLPAPSFCSHWDRGLEAWISDSAVAGSGWAAAASLASFSVFAWRRLSALMGGRGVGASSSASTGPSGAPADDGLAFSLWSHWARGLVAGCWEGSSAEGEEEASGKGRASSSWVFPRRRRLLTGGDSADSSTAGAATSRAVSSAAGGESFRLVSKRPTSCVTIIRSLTFSSSCATQERHSGTATAASSGSATSPSGAEASGAAATTESAGVPSGVGDSPSEEVAARRAPSPATSFSSGRERLAAAASSSRLVSM
mmetsp:Transcript_16467/g.45914  ORF Transcript_16467/g.45914 Transcript_16467/m.45914 type:complete len:565 (-) Transcript_16467:331-2025(-)